MNKMLRKLSQLMTDAKKSKFALHRLNFVMKMGVPFNRPHKLSISQLGSHSVVCRMRYKRSNFNHINGIHACAIATIGEYCAGVCLMQQFSPELYRLIMSTIQIDYHYQARQDILASAEFDDDQVRELKEALEQNDSVKHTMVVDVHDEDKNHIATVTTHWQVKPWGKVRLKQF
jgi:acyl-coenzyme A thioesterase PaaI-like protein